MLRLLSLCLVTCFVVECQAQCDALEGTSVSWTCSLSYNTNTTSFTELQWTLGPSSNSTIVSKCFPSGSCTNFYTPQFTANLTNNYTTTSTNTKSILTFTNVSRDVPFNLQVTALRCQALQWLYNGPLYNSYLCSRIDVFALPKSLPCVVFSVNATTKYVNCTVERSYPSIFCGLQISQDNVTFAATSPIVNYSMPPTNGTPMYYSGSCQLLLDKFFLGTSYFRVVVSPRYNYKYFVYSDSFVYKTVLDEGTTTQTSNATTSTELTTPSTSESSPVAAGIVGTSPNSGLVTGLAVAMGIFALIALVLAIFIAVNFLRKKKKKAQQQQQHVPPKTPAKPTSAVIPEGYNKVTSVESGEEPDNYYEEVNRPAFAGANPKQPEHDPEVYLNSPPVDNPSKPTKETAPKRLPYREPPGPHSNSPTVAGKNQGGVSFRGIEEQSSEAHEEDVYLNLKDLKLQKTT